MKGQQSPHIPPNKKKKEKNAAAASLWCSRWKMKMEKSSSVNPTCTDLFLLADCWASGRYHFCWFPCPVKSSRRRGWKLVVMWTADVFAIKMTHNEVVQFFFYFLFLKQLLDKLTLCFAMHLQFRPSPHQRPAPLAMTEAMKLCATKKDNKQQHKTHALTILLFTWTELSLPLSLLILFV